MIFALSADDSTTKLLQHQNNEPLTIDDLWDFPVFMEEDVELGVVPASGGNLLLVPVFMDKEDGQEEDARINLPATAHSQYGNDHMLAAPVAILVTALADLHNDFRKALRGAIEDGFLDPRWGIGAIKIKKPKHKKDCPLSNNAGLTYVVTGKNAGCWLAEAITTTEIEDPEENENHD